MTNTSRWTRHIGQVVCYRLQVKHPLYSFVDYFAPFPSAKEAGAVIDRLSARFPDADISLERLEPEAFPDWSEKALEDAYQLALANIDMVMGEVLPLTVVEAIALEHESLTTERAVALANQASCRTEDLLIFPGKSAIDTRQPVWVVFRKHLETDDPRKAETKVLWLRREKGLTGKSGGEISIMIWPFTTPPAAAEE